MKISTKLITLFICSFLFVVSISAQDSYSGRNRYSRDPGYFDIKGGVLAGFNKSWVFGDRFWTKADTSGQGMTDSLYIKAKHGMQLGGYADFKLGYDTYIHIGARYVYRNWMQKGRFAFSPYFTTINPNETVGMVELKVVTQYIEVPIQFKVRMYDQFFALLGPYVDINISEKTSVRDDYGQDLRDPVVVTQHYDNTSFGLLYGIKYQQNSGFNYLLEIHQGLSDISDYPSAGVSQPNQKLFSISLTAGYTFGVRDRILNQKSKRKGKL